jgi:hypothetical protein
VDGAADQELGLAGPGPTDDELPAIGIGDCRTPIGWSDPLFTHDHHGTARV